VNTTTTTTLLAPPPQLPLPLPPQGPLSPPPQQQQAPRTKHLRFHSATKGKTIFLFLSLLLKDNFIILKMYEGG